MTLSRINKVDKIFRYKAFYLTCFIFIGLNLLINWKEIIHFNDIPVYLFNIDYYKCFFTPHNRFSAVLVEYLPLLFATLKLDFKWFLFSFILNPLLSTMLLYGIYGFFSKRWNDGWVFILSLTIGIKHSFYYLVPEHFGYSFAVFSVLMSIFILEEGKSKFWYLYSLIIGISLAGSHLYVLTIVLVGFLYIMFSKNPRIKFRKLVFHLGIILGSFFIVKLFLPSDGYESDRMYQLISNIRHLHYLDRASFKYLFDRDHKYALDNVLLGLITILGLIAYRKYLIGLVILTIFYLTYYLNCLYSFEWLGTEYMELYGRLIYMCILVGSYIVYRGKSINVNLVFLLTAFFVFIYLYKTNSVRSIYTDRYIAIENFMDKYSANKIYCAGHSLIEVDKIWFSWALPHETLILSTLKNESKTVYVFNGDNRKYTNLNQHTFYGSNQDFPIKKLKNTYFSSLDTSSYIRLE